MSCPPIYLQVGSKGWKQADFSPKWPSLLCRIFFRFHPSGFTSISLATAYWHTQLWRRGWQKAVCPGFLSVVISHWPKATKERKGFVSPYTSRSEPSLREAGVGTQGTTPKADLLVPAISPTHQQIITSRNHRGACLFSQAKKLS